MFLDPNWHFVQRDMLFEIRKYDEVTNGCWRNTQTSVDRVSLELVRSQASIVEVQLRAATVVITALGYEINSTNCAVTVRTEVYAPHRVDASVDGYPITAVFPSLLWEQTAILTGPKRTMSGRVAETHTKHIRKFLIELSQKARELRTTALGTR
ncbi:hypothetical protein AVJ23_08640 [Pseudoponticoccus marisrubri]|uniref:Uncharacterized protein n=1 Tax=Pseudoponticoccus marisrubri TaxID=1685382 RepID=A0A0W7WKM0_9RHOB|nr:hypothetical protein AVJ23_08640 [Pseudoponticoccus marisrubri]